VPETPIPRLQRVDSEKLAEDRLGRQVADRADNRDDGRKPKPRVTREGDRRRL